MSLVVIVFCLPLTQCCRARRHHQLNCSERAVCIFVMLDRYRICGIKISKESTGLKRMGSPDELTGHERCGSCPAERYV
jgi:hypothetical protein